MIHVYGGYFFSECDLFETRTNGTKMPNKIHKLHEKLPNKIHKLSTAHCLSTCLPTKWDLFTVRHRAFMTIAG